MDAKEYLMQIRRLGAKLEVIDRTIDKLRADVEKLTDVSVRSSWPDGSPHGTKTTDPTGEAASKLADQNNARREELRKQLLEYEYQQLQVRSELWARQMEVLNTISMVKEPVLFNILNCRYVEGRSFEWIAVHINYTWRHTINLHGKALLEVQRILDEKIRYS